METGKVSHTDLLIVGAGPAGLMAAAWASRYKISARIIDKSSARVSRGHADGLQCRTMEILDSFGLAYRIRKEGFHDHEICFWDPTGEDGIHRVQKVPSQKVGVSRFPQTIIHQGYIEQEFLDFLERDGGLRVERCTVPREMSVDYSLVNQQDLYPIMVKIESSRDRIGEDGPYARHKPREATPNELPGPESNIETIKTKYLLGCDGAHSWTRQQLGINLEGNQTQNVWGVIDVIPLTDFPDVRQTCVIRSAIHGSIMIVPREGRLVRLYIQLSELSGKDGNPASCEITPAFIFEVAKKILRPYTLDFTHLDWWSVYRVQQRVASRFSVANRIFLAGDAIHTHSPKLGQGMNVSMQDTYNLGWKICSVINGSAKQEILNTYETERRQVALDLVAADKQINGCYTRRCTEHLEQNLDYQILRDSLSEFLSGASVNYGPSILTLKQSIAPVNGHVFNKEEPLSQTSPLASKLHIGMRVPSYKVINQADARCIHLGELLRSDARWRILTFAGNLADPVQFHRVRLLGEFLAGPASPVRRFTPSHRPIDAVIEILTVHSGPRAGLDLLHLHDIFHPWDELSGWDYWKVFVDERSFHGGFDDVYGMFGIDRQRGCLVICRPDQHVGCVLDLEDFLSIGRYFEGVLNPVG